MPSVDNSWSSGEYYYRLYWMHALIRHYLTTGRKYVLIKKYALNKHVHLLTRLYGITTYTYLKLLINLLVSFPLLVSISRWTVVTQSRYSRRCDSWSWFNSLDHLSSHTSLSSVCCRIIKLMSFSDLDVPRASIAPVRAASCLQTRNIHTH